MHVEKSGKNQLVMSSFQGASQHCDMEVDGAYNSDVVPLVGDPSPEAPSFNMSKTLYPPPIFTTPAALFYSLYGLLSPTGEENTTLEDSARRIQISVLTERW